MRRYAYLGSQVDGAGRGGHEDLVVGVVSVVVVCSGRADVDVEEVLGNVTGVLIVVVTVEVLPGIATNCTGMSLIQLPGLILS